MAGTHSRLSPSSAHRYSRCPGAPNAEAGLPDDPSRFAAEGTVFHEIAAWCLQWGMEPEDFLGAVFEEDGFEITVDADMVRYMTPGLARARELMAGPGRVSYVERRVDLSHILGEGEGGTADLTIIDTIEREIILWDWKYGQGVPVTAFENEQEMLYLLGAWNDLAWPLLGNSADVKVRLIIEQPRARGQLTIREGEESEDEESDEAELDDGDVSDETPQVAEWETTMDDVIVNFGWRMSEVAEATRDPNAPRVPGPKQCKFCKRAKTKGGCPERNEYLIDVFGQMFDDIDAQEELGVTFPLDHPSLLTPERRSWIVQHAPMLKKFLTDVHAHVVHDAVSGEPTPHLKVVAGRNPARKYHEGVEEKVEAILVEELGPEKAYNKKILSPAQAEKLLPLKSYAKIEGYVDKGVAKATLVPLSSNKKALPTHSDKFTDEDIEIGED